MTPATKTLPRIAEVATEPGKTLLITWRDGRRERITLAGWIATAGELIAPLSSDALFATAHVGEYGAEVAWDGDEVLRIDAYHLALLAAEQMPFGRDELIAWQERVELSNQESADFFGVALSTWNTWRAGASVPPAVAIAARAAERDPLVLQAHYRPRQVGRPPKHLAGEYVLDLKDTEKLKVLKRHLSKLAPQSLERHRRDDSGEFRSDHRTAASPSSGKPRRPAARRSKD